MRRILPKRLLDLANACQKPLYVVGGTVRDFLANLSASLSDWDICAPMDADEFLRAAEACAFSIKAVYKHTGTVKLRDTDGIDYEFTCFRSDTYIRGTHVPVSVFFTDDIVLDAKRRDFTANAVYYDIKADRFLDPLNGIAAIAEKRLTTVAAAEKVFGEDGLRLMRLARQAAQLGFTPDEECFRGAAQNAPLIREISPERIFTELNATLLADEKYGNADGAYQGIELLAKTGVLDQILPELTLGRNMAQRTDFHRYDVLEHSLRAVKYADRSVRLAALLHDVGKPFCMLRDGNTHEHHKEGARLAREILLRWKTPNKTIERVCALVETHMYDFDCNTSENKLRRFFVSHTDLSDDLLRLKQADFSACTDDLSVAPTCARWNTLLAKMHRENVPFSVKELNVDGIDILETGIPPRHVSEILKRLLLHTAIMPSDNEKARLLRLTQGIEKDIVSNKTGTPCTR